jgi:hypothetical protein
MDDSSINFAQPVSHETSYQRVSHETSYQPVSHETSYCIRESTLPRWLWAAVRGPLLHDRDAWSAPDSAVFQSLAVH